MNMADYKLWKLWKDEWTYIDVHIIYIYIEKKKKSMFPFSHVALRQSDSNYA